MLEQVPLRTRLVTTFAIAMTVLIVLGGAVVHSVVAGSIDTSIDQGLKARIDDLRSTIESRTGTPIEIPARTLVSEESSFAQVVGTDGTLIASSERFAGEPILTADQVRSALRAPLQRDRGDDGRTDAVRFLATRARTGGMDVVIVVGTSLTLRNRTLHDLGRSLYIGGIIGIITTTFLGFVVSRRALRAMDRIRTAADRIDHRSLGSQLPLPPANDELRALTVTLNELLRRIDHAFERERRFIADASHELRTPVALLKMELELALLEPHEALTLPEARELVTRYRARLESAEAEADRLGQLASALLIIAREDASDTSRDELELAPVELDVRAVIETIATRFEQRAGRAGRLIRIDLPEAPLKAFADAVRIEQAISNLVDNALRHGAGAITLHGRLTPAGSIEVRVSDEGAGIPRSERSRAFERFARGAAPTEQTGSGLGLAITRMIIASHGGTTGIDESGFVVMTLPEHQAQHHPGR